MKIARLYLILLALIALTPTAWAQGLSGSGTTEDPYLITSGADWVTFAQSVTNDSTYAGQTVKLAADIYVTEMVGLYRAFSGTLDGDGHTITLALSGGGEGTALFYWIENATLKNLKVQGTVTTTDRRPATFAVIVNGNSTISNCWSTVAVSSTRASGWVDGGGFVGRVSSNATLNMTDCAFHGSVTFTEGATTGGGMVGYTQNNATVNLTNCLYSPTALTLNVSEYNPRVFVSGSVEGNLTNCYYNDVAATSVLENQGTDASGMSNEELAAALGPNWKITDGLVVPFLSMYYIGSASEWHAFTTTLNNGTSFNGQTVVLTTDIPTAEEIANGTTAVTTMAGTESHPFRGTLDGGGHTITLALSGSGPGTALFYLIEGATLKNLKVQGTVTTTEYRPTTFAAIVEGSSTISNCLSTVDVSSTRANDWVDGGGMVARVSTNATLNMTGCAFLGSVTFTNGATTGGGMVGYTQNNATVNLTDCLYSPSALTLYVNAYNPRIFVCGEVAGNLINCYYNAVAAASVLGKQGQGKQAYSITGINGANVGFNSQATTYNVSSIIAYSVGMAFAGTGYAGETETVSLWLTHDNHPGYTYGNGYIASAGTLNGTGTFYTLTMPNQNVTIAPNITGYTVSVQPNPNIAGAAQVSLDNTTWSSSVNAAVGQEVYCKTNSVIGYRRAGFAIETENGEWVDLTDNHFTMPAANVIYSVDFSIDPTYSIEHTVTLSPGVGGGDPIVYTFDPATAKPNAATADTCQFYYVNYNTLGFRLPNGYCPNSFTAPYGLGFSGWSNCGDVTLTSTATTFTAQWGNPGPTVNYIDGNGEMHTLHYYTVLTGGEGETTLGAGWYVVDSDITYWNDSGTDVLTLNGDVTLILCNGKTMTVTANGSGINGNNHSLTIYGQSLDPNVAGTLNVNSTSFYAIYGLSTYTQHSGKVIVSSPAEAIYTIGFTLNGGSLEASGFYCGISTSNGGDLTINGGTVTANSTQTDVGFAGLSGEGNVVINGGKVEANKIFAGYNITLGYTHPDDYILAGEYSYNYYNNGSTVSVKSGQSFYYENEGQNVIVSGTIANPNSTIAGKRLQPYGLATYTLTPTAYTLTNDGYTDITCTLSSLELLEVWNGSSMVPATGLSFYMNGGTLTDSIGNSIPFFVDNGSHSGAATRKAQGGVFSSEGDTLIMAVYIDSVAFATAAPGTYTGEFVYDSYWNGNDNIHGPSGSIALTLVIPEPSTVTQTTNLAQGWNWFSTYIAIEDPEEGMQMLQAALGENGLKIISIDDYTTYEDGEWGAMGDLEELENEQTYMILTSAACTVELQGMPANPADYTITIKPGWNWIGFPSAEVMSVEEAFADFEAEEGDKIMTKDDYTTYEDGAWGAMGDLEELTPGQGLKYYSASTETKILVFPASAK